MFKIFTLSLYLIINLRLLQCETYSSVAAIVELLKTQAHLIKSITKSLKLVASEKERDIVEAYLDNLKKEHELSQRNPDPEHYLGNPINSYTLITRLHRDLLFVEEILNKTKSYKRESRLVYPSSDDAIGAAKGIIAIQIMYRLRISDLANGTLISHYSKAMEEFVEQVTPMTTNDCLYFGMFYFSEKDRSHCISWLEEAYKKYSTDHKLCNILESELAEQIGTQYFVMEDWSKSILWLEKLLLLKTTDEEAKKALEYAKLKFEVNKNKPVKHIDVKDPFGLNTNTTYMTLCRHDSRFIAKNASLVCYYAHGPHPFLILAPIKAEQLHRRPDILMFYDVISDKEIQTFKTHSKPLLGRSQVSETGEIMKIIRTSQIIKLSRYHPEVISVEERVYQFTGLRSGDIIMSEIEVANYGIGGGCSIHSDAFNVTQNNSEVMEIVKRHQRIATALFYMSEVEQGGATVFTNVNLTVHPVKNAALFWYNLDPWGNMNNSTLHGACPVIRGSKWIATKSFQQIEQERIRCPHYAPHYAPP